MAESVIGSAGEILSILFRQTQEKIGKSWGVQHEVQQLRDSFSTLLPVLNDATRQYYHSRQIQVWLERVKDTFYDVQDVLEELIIEATRRERRGHNEMIKEVRTFFSNSNQLAFKLKMSPRLRALWETIEAIKAHRESHLCKESESVDLRGVRDWTKREERYLFRQVGQLIGRDDELKEIMRFLLNSEVTQHVSILLIVGSSGVGKTTLAQRLYNNERVTKCFDLKMWTCVSGVFDAVKMVKNIITCAKKKEPADVAMERLKSELSTEIDGKRYLLVLDDLRITKKEEWQSLETLLMGGARGSKILITTQDKSVAEITSTAQAYFLKGLTPRDSHRLLLQAACREEEQLKGSEMLAICRVIVSKCSGVPLILRTIGSLLFFRKTVHECTQIIYNELLEVSKGEERVCVMPILQLSYDYLPSHLKQCFAFCSLFPRNYEINKQTLINLWVAEGFVLPSDSQRLEDIAHGYFMDLLWSNFFQEYKKDPFTNKETCKMHPLMHELACKVAGSDCWATWHGKTPELKPHHISHGLTHDFISKLPATTSKASSLRTFLYAPIYREMEQRKPTNEADIRQLIRSHKKLRILDLYAAIVEKVPRSICQLEHLTYLDLSHNSALKRLPDSISRLQNLQTLNLQGCFALEELPKGIRKLVKLRNLDIDYCFSLSYLPRGLEQLSSLQRLTRFILPKGKALAKNYCGLGELNGLNSLRGSLSIENLSHSRDALADGEVNLMGKHYLESLILKWRYCDTDDAVISNTDENLLDKLRPHSDLHKLTIDGYEGESFPGWMMESLAFSLPNLVEVRLLRCGRCKHLPQLGQLTHLKSLEIWRLTELESIESEHSSTSTVSFRSLLRLEIRYCKNLKAMPQIPLLEDLILTDVNQDLIIRIIGLGKLKSLDISQMESLECLSEKSLQSLSSLERLGISECPRLTSLPVNVRHMPNLVHLSFSNCEELDLSKGESDNILDLPGLKSLRFVDILGVPKLVSLPQWLLQVSNLERLSIRKCSNFKALPEKIDNLQSLRWLEIIRCPSLTSLPGGMRRLKFLSHLKIAGCPELEDRCKKDEGEDWDKIKHIPHITDKLEYYERHL